MDAFDAVEDLTELGHHLTDLPLDPQLGKMVLYSVVLKCLDPILTITCTLAYKDPFLLPSLPSDKRAANAARWRFAADTFSDHMAYLRAFQAWQKARADGWERAFCEKNFLSSATFEMIVGMRTQLLGQLRASGFVRARGGGDIRDLNSNSENWGIVKAALCAGSYPNLLRVDRGRQCLVTQKKDKVHIHPGSVLAQGTSEAKLSTAKSLKQALVNFPADWLIYDEISQRERLAFVKCCTLVSPITIALFGGPAKLPSDTLREAEHAPQSAPSNGEGEYVDPGSDSESEERTDWQKPTLRLDEWVSLKAPPEIMNLAVHLRQKWHALFFRRMRAPSKPWSQIDEAVLRAVVNVVTTEEQQMAIQQPAGIGQRPRPMSAESFQPNYGRTSYDYEENNTYYDSRGNKRTSRKSPATTPKRSPVCFGQSTPEPRGGYRQGGGNSGNPNCGSSQRGSASTTPCASPGPMSHPQSLEFEKLTKQPARFFVMKCRTEKNLETSFAQGTWQTTVQMERKISEALQDGKAVYIIASIRSTQFFNGYGEVISTGNKGKNASSKEGQLNVQWIREGEVPFYMTQYLVNTYGNRKIQQSRDGEEIEPKVAEAFLRIWERFPSGQSQSGQSQNRHPGSGDGPGKSPSSSQPQSSHTGQVGDGRYFNQSMRSGPGEYAPSPSVITSTSSYSGAHHTFSMFTGPDQARSAAGSDAVYSRNSPRFVTPVMSPGGQHNNNNAQLTILQRGMPNPSQRQQQAKPVPGSYHGSGPGAYHPSQHRGHYGHH